MANDTLDNRAAYIAYWRKFLTEHKKAFVEAAGKASKAVEYMRGLALAEERDELPIAA